MSQWSNNNLAHLHTWFNLHVLGQTDKPFPDTGKLTMKELTYWSSIDSDDMRGVIAGTHAVTLHNLYLDVQKAKYEDDFNDQKTISAIRAILVDADKTVTELADTSDQALKFPWES